MRTLGINAFLFLIAAMSPVIGQETPDFSGTYELNPKKGKNLGMVAAVKETIVVSQTADGMVIDFTDIFQGDTTTRQVTYDFSGEPTDNFAAMGDPSQTVSAWTDGKLVTTWTSEGAIAGTEVVRTETRSVSDEGQTMTVENSSRKSAFYGDGLRSYRMKPAILITAIVLTASVGSGGYWGWGLMTGDDNSETVVSIVSPQWQSITSTVLATGAIRPKVGAEVRVGSQMSGIVEKLNVTVGSKIKQGDIIAVIDSRTLEARLNQALAQVNVLEQEVRRVEVQLARVEKLDTRGFVARSQVEDLTIELAETEARLEKARRDADVVTTDLEYAQIRAPISGTVASVSTQEGETVAASFATPTFVTIIDSEALELVALVDETDIGTVAIGNPVIFTVESYPTTEFEGIVTQIAPQGTLISGVVNFEVMISIESVSDTLRPDMTANVSIETAEREAIIIPNAAVQRDGFERFVYIEKEGELLKRTVTVGTRDGAGTEIRQGVELNDRIAIPSTTNPETERDT